MNKCGKYKRENRTIAKKIKKESTESNSFFLCLFFVLLLFCSDFLPLERFFSNYEFIFKTSATIFKVCLSSPTACFKLK